MRNNIHLVWIVTHRSVRIGRPDVPPERPDPPRPINFFHGSFWNVNRARSDSERYTFSDTLLTPFNHLLLLLSAIHNTTSHNDQSFCVIPGDTVKAVEVVGGGARALEALGLTKASSMPRVSHDGAGVSSAHSNPFSQSPLGSPFNKRSPVLKSGGYWRKDESLSSSMHTPRSPLARAGSNDSDKDSDLDATSFDANTFPVFLRERFARVRELLESARIPVYVERGYESSHDVLIAMGCVRVTAPYGVQNCECGNLAVLERVREIVGDAK